MRRTRIFAEREIVARFDLTCLPTRFTRIKRGTGRFSRRSIAEALSGGTGAKQLDPLTAPPHQGITMKYVTSVVSVASARP